jgi:Tol biopolymer transport system component
MLVFSSTRAGGSGSADLWVSRRASRGEAFSAPAALGGVNSSAYEGRAALASDQRSIIFASRRDGGRGNNDLWAASRTSLDQDFGPAENLVELNSSDADIDPSLSDDGRELLFVSNRRGRSEIFRATRPCD